MVFRKPVFSSVIPRGGNQTLSLALYSRTRGNVRFCTVETGLFPHPLINALSLRLNVRRYIKILAFSCLGLNVACRFPVAPRGDCIGGAHGPDSIAYPIFQLLAQLPNIRVGGDYYRGAVVVSPVDDFKQAFPCPITGLFRKRKKRL